MVLKLLTNHVKYVFLEDNSKKPISINNSLSKVEEQKLVRVLTTNQGALGWHICWAISDFEEDRHYSVSDCPATALGELAQCISCLSVEEIHSKPFACTRVRWHSY